MVVADLICGLIEFLFDLGLSTTVGGLFECLCLGGIVFFEALGSVVEGGECFSRVVGGFELFFDDLFEGRCVVDRLRLVE